jgi:hypothetical protein
MNASPTDPRVSRRAGDVEISSALGWRFFAGIVMLLLGIMNLIDGIIAITDSDVFEQNLSAPPSLPVTDNMAVWGWVVLVLGFVMMVLAFPVIVGFPWARFAGIAAAGVDLLLEFAFLAHFPLWSLIIISLNVVVIFGLAVRGGAPTEFDRLSG